MLTSGRFPHSRAPWQASPERRVLSGWGRLRTRSPQCCGSILSSADVAPEQLGCACTRHTLYVSVGCAEEVQGTDSCLTRCSCSERLGLQLVGGGGCCWGPTLTLLLRCPVPSIAILCCSCRQPHTHPLCYRRSAPQRGFDVASGMCGPPSRHPPAAPDHPSYPLCPEQIGIPTGGAMITMPLQSIVFGQVSTPSSFGHPSYPSILSIRSSNFRSHDTHQFYFSVGVALRGDAHRQGTCFGVEKDITCRLIRSRDTRKSVG